MFINYNYKEEESNWCLLLVFIARYSLAISIHAHNHLCRSSWNICAIHHWCNYRQAFHYTRSYAMDVPTPIGFCCWLLLYSAVLCSWADSLRLHVILHEWLAFYGAFLNSHQSGVLTVAVATWNCSQFSVFCVHHTIMHHVTLCKATYVRYMLLTAAFVKLNVDKGASAEGKCLTADKLGKPHLNKIW